MKNILIIGPQASGKGTQAEEVAKKLHIPHISIGEVLRHEVAKGTKLGKLLNTYMSKGELIPADLNDDVAEHMLQKTHRGVILDGYPRTTHQTEFLDKHMIVDAVIVLHISDEECIRRIGGRRVCANGHDYHIEYKAPKKAGVCDHDGLPLVVREDDTPKAIKKRLTIYHEQTEKVLDVYRSRNIVIDINADEPISEVTQEIFVQLKKRFNLDH